MNAVWLYVQRISLWLGVSLLFVQPGVSQDRALATETAPLASPQETVAIERGTFLQLELAERVDWKHLAHNSRVEGR
jgi:DNA-binding transcriptional regulator YdaS (Cro superfamily)